MNRRDTRLVNLFAKRSAAESDAVKRRVIEPVMRQLSMNLPEQSYLFNSSVISINFPFSKENPLATSSGPSTMALAPSRN